jgi:thiamine biosynthesis lipoprotein ApbE
MHLGQPYALAVVCFSLWSWTDLAAAGESRFAFHHEHVLGTSLDIHVVAHSQAAAEKAEASILREIERLRGVLSTYDGQSEVSRWSAGPAKPTKISSDLLRVLQQSDEWRARSGGAFNVGAGGRLPQWWPRHRLSRWLWRRRHHLL